MGLFNKNNDNSFPTHIRESNTIKREKIEIEFVDVSCSEYTTLEVYKDQISSIKQEIIDVITEKKTFIEIIDTEDRINIINKNAILTCIITL